MNITLNKSIGMKISTIIGVSAIGLLIIVALSLVVFSVSNKLNVLTRSEGKHNIGYYKAMSNFGKYTIFKDMEYYNTFHESISQATSMNGRFGEILEGLKHMTPDETIDALAKKDPNWNPETSPKMVKLFSILSSNDRFLKLAHDAAKCHEITSKVQELGEKYMKTDDEKKRRTILSEMIVYDKDFEELVVSFTKSMADLTEELSGFVKLIFLVLTVIVLIPVSIIAYFITKSITRPLKETVIISKSISGGDFTYTINIKNKDELGILANTINKMVTGLNEIIRDVLGGVDTLSNSSGKLSDISEQLDDGTRQTSTRSNNVAAAAEEMSINFNSVASSMEQFTNNINMVAASIEEMTATVDEIAGSSENASSITKKAVTQADSATVQVNELEKSAQDISKVTEAITEISEQTNLLALNATIEAARAGEAGKGFAVVANEIKELARQTSDATHEIKKKIDRIQSSTSGAIDEIEQISKIIEEVNDIVGGIAAAIEEQSVTTREISGNVAQITTGIQEVTENVVQSSNVAGDISKEISEVHQSTNEMSNNSSMVNNNAGELMALAEQLKEKVSRFKV